MSGGDYKVGRGKPPKHSQFPPGTSGNKGRKKKFPKSHKEIVARIRDEIVEVSGHSMTKFELAVRSTTNNTIKSGKPRDLKVLLELLDKYGGVSERDLKAETMAAAEEFNRKFMTYIHRSRDIDPADVEAVERDGIEEARIVLACPHCGPIMRERWKDPERKARKKRFGKTGLQEQVDELFTVKKQPGKADENGSSSPG